MNRKKYPNNAMMKCLFQIVLEGSRFSIFLIGRVTHELSSVLKATHPVKNKKGDRPLF